MTMNPEMQSTINEAVQAVTDSIIDRGPSKFTPSEIAVFYLMVAKRLQAIAAEAGA